MIYPLSASLLLFLSFVALTQGNWITDLFNPGLENSPQFQNSQLYRLDPSTVGLDDVVGYIGCFGDLNSDKYTDLFVITGEGNETAVVVYLWNNIAWQFGISDATVVSPFITNVAAGDFNYDGKLDLMVSGNNETNNNTYVKIFIGDHKIFSTVPVWEFQATSQVSILDADNDLRPDFFGEIPADLVYPAAAPVSISYNVSNTTDPDANITSPTNPPNPGGNVTGPPRRAYWVNKGNGEFNLHLEAGGASLFPLRVPHSNAFVDLNGDCLADRFVTSVAADGTPQYEIWINQKNKGYILKDIVALPLGAGQVTFADFDRDGNLDFIVPVCYPRPNCTEENSIYLIRNKQKKLCPLLSKSSSCRSQTALCTPDPNFKLGMINQSATDPLVMVVTSDKFDTGFFYVDDDLGRPLTLRVGDFNLDGYPDLLIPIVGEDGTPHIELWKNTVGGDSPFTRQTGGVDDLEGIPNAYAAAFFDLDEDGVADMLVLADDPPRIETVYNNFENDAFFLKALGLNGVCPEWCKSGPQFPNPKPYGVNYVGGVFKYTYTDLTGHTIQATGTQLQQSAYLSLYTPYILFGLGRTSNYIEQFFFGATLNQSVHFNYWTGSTIPNSQVVAVPYKPESPQAWTLELYITPSGLLFWIMVALIGSLIILASVVFYFYRKEKKEDELQKQEQAHLFSFDAL